MESGTGSRLQVYPCRPLSPWCVVLVTAHRRGWTSLERRRVHLFSWLAREQDGIHFADELLVCTYRAMPPQSRRRPIGGGERGSKTLITAVHHYTGNTGNRRF